MLTLIGFSQMRLVYLLVASIRAWFPRLPTVASPNPSSILAGWAGHKFMHTKQTSIVAKIADETDSANIISSLNLISARSLSSVVINSFLSSSLVCMTMRGGHGRSNGTAHKVPQ